MSFWDILTGGGSNSSAGSSNDRGTIHTKLKKLLPQEDDAKLETVACIAGLFARVAHADYQIDQSEKEAMNFALNEWTSLAPDHIQGVVELAISETKKLAGLENQTYTRHLCEVLNQDERYGLVEALFALAAADDSVENSESEEIRLINQGLKLSPQHFTAARATVAKKLAALKK